ncbi:MAG TPA: ABC transporter permease [Thermoanaerobaculia bacterium]|nr:ABC transporter permease [Thermoanaerobaculia bacterium]
MTETVYTADPALRHPRRFLASAKEDLRNTATVAWHLFRRNVQVRYRRTWLGYAWLLLPIIATTLVWVYINARRLVVIAAPEIPYPVHVLAGMALWQTFVDALNAPLQQLAAGRQLVTRSRVPLEALVLAGVLEALSNCAVRLVVLASMLITYDVPIGWSVLFAPLGIAALMLLGLAFGVFLAPVGLLYDDVGRAVVMVTGLWFFLTPVIYRAPEEGILRLNPVTPLLETTRAWLTSSAPAADGFVLVTAAAAALLVVAWVLLRLARPHVVERLG